MPSAINSSTDRTHRRRRRRATAAAALAIFASAAHANTIIVQPSDLPVHSPSEPFVPLTKQQPPIEYYPPPHSEAQAPPQLSRAQNVKPHIVKKSPKKKKTQHESHSPWHTAEYFPQRLGSSPTSTNQVILRPRPSYTSDNSVSASSQTDGKTIYYYDPSSLFTSVESPTLTLPEIIYDADGNVKKLEEVHDGGKNEVFLEVKPKAVWGEKAATRFHRLQNLRNGSNNSSAGGDNSQDQLIVFGTIATMALMVGMLSAKRLRNQRLLGHCMESDLEDWEEEKKDGPPENKSMSRGFGEVMGGKRYESFGNNLHWRGDMEKFDV